MRRTALAGKGAAAYTEGTGLFVSAYNLLTVRERYGVPMLLIGGFVGSFEDQRNSFCLLTMDQDDRPAKNHRHRTRRGRLCLLFR